METTYFYCQECNHRITVDGLASLDAGKCPVCSKVTGFSTAPKEQNDPFETVTMINDAEMLEKTLQNGS